MVARVYKCDYKGPDKDIKALGGTAGETFSAGDAGPGKPSPRLPHRPWWPRRAAARRAGGSLMAPPAGARATAKCRPRGIRTSSADTAARTQLRRQPRPPPPGPPAPPQPGRRSLLGHTPTAGPPRGWHPRLLECSSACARRFLHHGIRRPARPPRAAGSHGPAADSLAPLRQGLVRGQSRASRPSQPPARAALRRKAASATPPGGRAPPACDPPHPAWKAPWDPRPRPARGPRWPTPCPPPCPATPGPAPSRATELPGPLREQQRDRTQADGAVGGRAGRGAQPRRPALEDRGLGRLPQARLLEDVAFATALAGRGHRPGTRGRTAAPLSLPGQGGNGGASRHRHGAPLPPQRTLGRSVTCPPSRSTHGPIRTDRGTTEHVPREDQSQLAKEGES